MPRVARSVDEPGGSGTTRWRGFCNRASPMHAVIIVASGFPMWAAEAEAILTTAGYHVARIPDLRASGFLVLGGGIRAILVDRRRTGPTWAAQRARLLSLSPATQIAVIGELTDLDLPPLSAGAVPWPIDSDEARTLLGSLIGRAL